MADNIQSNAANQEAAPANKTGLATIDFTDSKFFQELDKKVVSKPESKPEKKAEPTQQTESEIIQELEDTKKKYGESSKEAKRLKEKLDDYQRYDNVMPIVDALYKDPKLVNHVMNYFEKGGETSDNIKDQLNLDEDFIFDGEDAFKDPNSDSAKVLRATIGSVVRNELKSFQDKISRETNETKAYTDEMAFRQKNNISDEEWDDFLKWSKETKSTRENAWKWYNFETKKRNVINNEANERMAQLKKMQNTSPTAADLGHGNAPGQDVEDKLFDAIMKESLQAQDIIQFDK